MPNPRENHTVRRPPRRAKRIAQRRTAAEPRPSPVAAPSAIRLPGGARVVVQTTSAGAGSTTVAIQLWVFAGTFDERPREHGCAHLLEHMLFKPVELGGERVDIAADIERVGGDVNAYTSHDETVFHATVPAGRFEEALAALVRPIVHARPRAADLAHERGVVIEEIKQYDDDPVSCVTQDMMERLYGRHGYARPVLGTAAEIAAHRTGVLAGFLRRNYAGERVALVVVGPVGRERVLAAARPLLRGLARSGVRSGVRAPAAVRAPGVHVRRDDVHEAHISLGFVAPPWPEREACALEIAANALGWGEASWLARGLRRRLGLVTDAHASLLAGRQASTFVVAAHGPPAKLEAAAAGILDLVERLRTLELDDEELVRARAVLESDVVYRRETVHGQAHALGYYLSLADHTELDRVFLDRLKSLGPADVRDICRTLLDPRRGAMALVVPSAMPAAQSRRIARALERRMAAPPRRRARSRLRRDRDGFHLAELACGLRVRMLVDASVPMAAGWMVWRGGQRVEPARLAGSTALAAALLTRGSGERDGDTLAREIDGRAAVLDGLAGRNSVGLHFECLARDVSTVLRRAFDCAMAPRFGDEELDHERRLALEDLAAERDDLAGLATAAAAAKLYGRHPFGRRRRGSATSLRAIAAGDLQRAWQRHYGIAGASLGLCGDLDPEAVLELLDGLTAHVDATDAPVPVRLPRVRHGAGRIQLRRRREQAHVVMMWPGLTVADDRVPALEVLSTILGGQVGRLFVALREEQGLVYHVSSSSVEGLDTGHVSFYAASSHAKLARALAALERQRARICDERPSAEELDRAKAWLVGQAETALQRRGRVASLLAFNEAYDLGYAAHLDYARRIDAVTGEHVVALARALLRPAAQVTAVVAG